MTDDTRPAAQPMGPEDLAGVRRMIRSGLTRGQRVQLLADRDHWEAEAAQLRAALVRANARATFQEMQAQRYRDRCPVEASDVEAAGLTWAKVDAWVDRHPDSGRLEMAYSCMMSAPSRQLLKAVEYAAVIDGSPAWEILDEMAMEPTP